MRRLCWGIWIALVAMAAAPAAGAQSWTPEGGGSHGGADWTPADGDRIAGEHTGIGEFRVEAGGTVFVKAYDGANFGKVTIRAGKITIEGILEATAYGHRGGGSATGGNGEGPGGGEKGGYDPGATTGWSGGGGAGYGGAGAIGGGSDGGAGGSSYGSPSTSAAEMGSGGGEGGKNPGYGDLAAMGGYGGGAIELHASGDIVVNGKILASGQDGSPQESGYSGAGGGAGGGILLVADGKVTFGPAADIIANGGNGSSATVSNIPGLGAVSFGGGGGGAGGRVKIFAGDTAQVEQSRISVAGGSGGASTGGYASIPGEPGGTGSVTVGPVSQASTGPGSSGESPSSGSTVGGPSLILCQADGRAPRTVAFLVLAGLLLGALGARRS